MRPVEPISDPEDGSRVFGYDASFDGLLFTIGAVF